MNGLDHFCDPSLLSFFIKVDQSARPPCLMPLLYFYVLWVAYLKASKTLIVLAYLLVPATGFIVLSVIRKRNELAASL